MEYPDASVKGRIFVSCKKQKHYSRELILDQHALVYVLAGTLELYYADKMHRFGPGTTVIIPRNQLGRMIKSPANGEPFRSISILFPEQLLRKFYGPRPENVAEGKRTGHVALTGHPLLESLFTSLIPYFEMQDELPPDLVDIKVMECLTVLEACCPQAKQLLSMFQEPGKVDLADFMEKHFQYNLPLEKFGYLTGRSLTTFKKDFQKVFRTTPGRWLTTKRLEHAHYQIAVKKHKPSEIFVDAGFENLSHFSHVFKKHFGYNPSEAGS
ncbi:AraC family transcriptional regulator [Flavitalea sp. BT771]|uniref:AraC family transcriptional regulator n=1 Tax=Flavitalea sp. BT771 TaxID=3063329 RepID=UPI0026E2CABB|nr:AraC family transcriptional regulator [Flavitalea sp. BT771]MDO6432690.1 AraC family transcriptional regulator [Flavitalea sp. BT771]MDV6222034.1 AraC family transcriptional regulator [Flavitalea sp. BT771]